MLKRVGQWGGDGGRGGGGVRWEIKNVLLYAILEPYTKVQVYHASPL